MSCKPPLLGLVIGMCAAAAAPAAATSAAVAPAGLKLSSPAFRANHSIPAVYSCDGKGVSPPLRWMSPPRRTRSLALRLYDRDARFVHWLAWRISPSARSLARGHHPPYEGRNDFGKIGYGPPCPPAGRTHHYVFTLYALARPLRLARGAGFRAFTAAVHRAGLLASSSLVGTYRRG